MIRFSARMIKYQHFLEVKGCFHRILLDLAEIFISNIIIFRMLLKMRKILLLLAICLCISPVDVRRRKHSFEKYTSSRALYEMANKRSKSYK